MQNDSKQIVAMTSCNRHLQIVVVEVCLAFRLLTVLSSAISEISVVKVCSAARVQKRSNNILEIVEQLVDGFLSIMEHVTPYLGSDFLLKIES